MKFHEKTLELNITHELLNLADSYFWFLKSIPLWNYWKPGHRLPFFFAPKSTAGGFHITTEGKDDPTGQAGGGFDVRIKSGIGNHLLFIQYKQGDLETSSPSTKSIFSTAPHEHFKFKINSTRTNQHFVLRNLAGGIGGVKGNAVVYAFPLIADMKDLEANAGNLIRKTKFISVADIDNQAALQIPSVSFTKGKEHNFRVGKDDMNRCEVNYFYFSFTGKDRTPEIVADIIGLKFQEGLVSYLESIEYIDRQNEIYKEYITLEIRQSFPKYLRYLLHYFEVSPEKLSVDYLDKYAFYFYPEEFTAYENQQRDINILNAALNALSEFEGFIANLQMRHGELSSKTVPEYPAKFLYVDKDGEGLNIRFEDETSKEIIEELSILAI